MCYFRNVLFLYMVSIYVAPSLPPAPTLLLSTLSLPPSLPPSLSYSLLSLSLPLSLPPSLRLLRSLPLSQERDDAVAEAKGMKEQVEHLEVALKQAALKEEEAAGIREELETARKERDAAVATSAAVANSARELSLTRSPSGSAGGCAGAECLLAGLGLADFSAQPPPSSERDTPPPRSPVLSPAAKMLLEETQVLSLLAVLVQKYKY